MPTDDTTRQVLRRLAYIGVPLDRVRWLEACDEYGAMCDAEHAVDFDRTPWRHLPSAASAEGRLHPTWQRRGATVRYYGGIAIHGDTRYMLPSVPKGAMRDAIRTDGSIILSADWSASQVRLLADLSGDAALISSLSAVDGDPYLDVTLALGLDPSERPKVKTAVLHALNGGGIGSRWPLLPFDAHRLEKVLQTMWPDAWAMRRSWRDEAKATGQVTVSGQRIAVPRNVAYAAAAYVLQAVESQALIRAVSMIQRAADAGLAADVILTAHDEVVVEVTAPDILQTALVVVQEAMQDAPRYAHSELRNGAASVTWGPSWGQQDCSGAFDASAAGDPHPEIDGGPWRDYTIAQGVPWSFQWEDGEERAVAMAYRLLPDIQAAWPTQVYGDGCLGASLSATNDAQDVSWGQRCRQPTCYYCGPWQVAMIIAAVVHCPLRDADDHIIGRPMGARALVRYDIPESVGETWERQVRRAHRWTLAFGRISSNCRSVRRNPAKTEQDPGAPPWDEAHAFIAVPKDDGGFAAWTTLPTPIWKRRSKPPPKRATLSGLRRRFLGLLRQRMAPLPAGRLHVEFGLGDEMAGLSTAIRELLTPVLDEAGVPHLPMGRPKQDGDGAVSVERRKIRSSNRLHLDPRETRRRSQHSRYRRLHHGQTLPSPATMARRARQLSRTCHVRQDDSGAISGVSQRHDTLRGNLSLYRAALAAAPEDFEAAKATYLASRHAPPVPAVGENLGDDDYSDDLLD